MSLPQSRSIPPIDAKAHIERWRDRFERVLDATLPEENLPPVPLHRAMRYAALLGGKRIRPLLVYGAGFGLNLPEERLDRIAASIEIIHAYSLIHDDLPSMDDDDLRRGRPSVHRAFDEATAILAGDALQALAFEVLSKDGTITAPTRLEIASALARSCGSLGMAGGQMLDLAAVGKTLGLEELEAMHRLKTGALIELCLSAPAMVANAEPRVHEALSEYGACIGLAFQIHDDILDVTGETSAMGKTARGDLEKDKPTFPSVIGLERSRERARDLRDRARAALERCQGNWSVLNHLADYVIRRDR